MLAMNIRYLLLFSAIFRMILIIYGEWQDSHMEVRYTDVDYLVFTDAASFMASGDSPYKRTTYRYSPLLAFLLIPNSFIHHSWGKFLFSASDLLVGLFIHTILKLRRVPEDLCMYSVMVWLFNPFTFTIGTRGNCEPIVCAMILWIIICLMNGNVLQAAFWYGLVVHFRIYPIIYALPIILVLDPHSFQSGLKPKLLNWSSSQVKTSHSSNRGSGQYDLSTTLKSLFSMRRIMFGLVSGSVFLLCTSLFFYLYRWEFLHEALLYHLTRTDPRHNFSIYFYHIYLHSEHEFSVLERLISFLPQFIVQLILMFSFAQDLPFCLFLQTVAFVAFNKVHNQLCFFMKRLDASSICRNISKEATYTFALIDLMRVALRFLFGVNLICSILFALFEAIFNCPVFDFNITARTVSLQVITAQYFVWFFCLLPLILPWSKMKLKWEGLCCILVWMGAQTHWLMWAYMLEFKGKNVFVQLWLASILFLAANSFVLILIIRRHKFSPVFERWDHATPKNAVKLK